MFRLGDSRGSNLLRCRHVTLLVRHRHSHQWHIRAWCLIVIESLKRRCQRRW